MTRTDGMSREPEYDLIAIGGGTAGLVAAAGAVGIGAPRVALIERDRLGGECLWTGCVPSKALIACARAASDARDAGRFGVKAGDVSIDAAAVWRWVRSARSRIEPHDSPERFRKLGVEVIQGEARFASESSLLVDGQTLNAKRVVIATGSRPALPPIDGLNDGAFYTNETLFDLDYLPSSLVILGAGPIGLEMAQAFTRLGTAVTVVESGSHLLAHEDRELADMLGERLRADGVTILLGSTATRVTYGDGTSTSDHTNPGNVTLELHQSDGRATDPTHVTGDALLVATGRKANIESLDLARGSVATDKNGIVVSSTMRTSNDRVWAAGDVTGTLRFTHVAEYEARLVVRNAFFPFDAKVDYSSVPWVTFTDPELAHLGLTEDEARDQFGAHVTVWRKAFDDIDRAITDGHTEGLVKIIAGRKGRILGAHILGHGAGNMIGQLTIAMRAGLTLSDVANTIQPYPVYPDAIRQAANQYQKSRFTGVVKSVAGWLAAR